MPPPVASLTPAQAASASIASSILNGAQPAMAGHMQTVAKTYDASTPKKMSFNGKPVGQPFYRGDLQQQPGPTNTIGNIDENTGAFSRYQGASGHTAQSTSVGRFVGAGVGAGMPAPPKPPMPKQGSAMTDKQMFKVAFLAKCIDEGLTIDGIKLRVKQALHFAKKEALEKRALDWSTLGMLPLAAAALGIGGSYWAGNNILGPGLHQVTKPRLPSKEDLLAEELVNEYDKQTENVTREAELTRRRRARDRNISGITRY